MPKCFIVLILALLLLLAAKARPLPNTEEQQADQNLPFSSPESISFIDGECGGLNDEECMIRRSLAAHTDYIYTQENDAP
ncbi:phytosulfokine 4 precursor [Hibiscus trionum]|uniref:Phytosulfokine n=1 Tax=Hibiscus trionum TaxID=183268 RepID=A0A9W7IRS2_HIBTR|nr:phytosulfokine 4 precursor [Hibiscus trionum]